MGHPLVIEPIRRRIVELLQQRWTYSQTAHALGVGVATVNRVWRTYRETGSTKGPPRKGGQKSKISGHLEVQFRQMLDGMPFATYDELTVAWNKLSGQKVSRSALVRKVLKMGYTRKKKSVRAVEKRAPQNKVKIAKFESVLRLLPTERLVFLDESGFQCKLSRNYGRSARGTRLVCYEPAAYSKNFTITGAVRTSGPVVMRGSAKSMTLVRFLRFLRHDLLPRLTPGDILVMDNLAAHRNWKVPKLCSRWDVKVLYLPPYCPEYNPIEQVWAWMKNRLRGRANRAVNAFRYAISGAWRKAKNLSMEKLAESCGYRKSCEAI